MKTALPPREEGERETWRRGGRRQEAGGRRQEAEETWSGGAAVGREGAKRGAVDEALDKRLNPINLTL